MQSRRIFLHNTLLTLVVFSLSGLRADAWQISTFQGKDSFKRILAKAKAQNWVALPIGELMGKIALELEGTPYVANTLELSPDHEYCSVDFLGLDCVTFFETTLGFARMLKTGGHTPADLLKAITFTRYRGGKIGDYTSRLHYTTDWFRDNEAKHVVEILSSLPGAEPFKQKVGYMSSHPESSKQLASHPELITVIKKQEEDINNYSLAFVPKEKIAAVEPLLKTGDIVGICTNVPGLDIAHTGLVFRDSNGVAHFMDASSRKNVMKVVLESGPISQTLTRLEKWTGAIFARPLEPRS
jgi:Protein of unknown function (DUF1460)